jgi:hypothetical protein
VFQVFTDVFGPGFTKTDHLPSPVALHFAAHDPDIIFNQQATPLLWTPPDVSTPRPTETSAPGPRPTPEQWQSRLPYLEKVGQQLQGPCPACGEGEDRFHVNLSPPYLYQCRVCDSRGDGSAPFRVVFGPQLHLFDPPDRPVSSPPSSI